MGRIKNLFKNISIFGVSQLASKLLVFILLPFYTSRLTTAEYGISDLIFTTVQLVIPLVTMELPSAVMRFTMDNMDRRKDYFTTALLLIILGLMISVGFYFLIDLLNLFDGYIWLFYSLLFTSAFYNLLGYYSRGLGKIMLVGIIGIINTATIVACNLVFLLAFNFGIAGYLGSYVIGNLISIVVFIPCLCRHLAIKKKYLSKSTISMMYKYSLPLIPNNIAWWGVSSVNKFIIKGFVDDGTLGLYSVALKIPTIITTVQGIISEGLVISVLSQYNEEKNDEKFFSEVYKVYSLFTIIVTVIVIALSKVIAMIMFSTDFASAWVFIPLLCLSPLWGALSGYLGTFYSAENKTLGIFISTIIGAAIAVIIGIVFIRLMGIYSLLLGNALAYFAIWLYRYIDTRRFHKLKVNMLTDISSWIVLIGMACGITFCKTTIQYVLIAVVGFIIIICISLPELVRLVKKLKSVKITKNV